MLIKGIYPVDISPDSKYLVSNVDSTKIQIIELETGNIVKIFEFDDIFCGALSLKFNLDGKTITLSCMDGLFVIDLNSLKIIKSFKNLLLPDLYYSRTEKYLGTIWDESTDIEISDVKTGQLLMRLEGYLSNLLIRFKGHQDVVRSISFSNNEKYLASCDRCKIIIWNLEDGSIIKDIETWENNDQVFFSSNDKWLITTYYPPGDSTGVINFWDTALWKKVDEIRCKELSHIDYSKDGKYIGTNPIFDEETGKFSIKVFDAHNKVIIKRIHNGVHNTYGTLFDIVLISPDNSKVVIVDQFKSSRQIIEILNTGLN